MDTPESGSRYVARNPRKRGFPGESSSSSGYEEVVFLETAPSRRRLSRPSSAKKKEIACEIIDLDIEEERENALLIDGKDGIHGKGKETATVFSVPSSTLSNEGSKNVDLDDLDLFLGENDWIEKYYDDIMFDDDTFLESQFDQMDIPHGVEIPFPSLTGGPSMSMNSTTPTSSSLKIEATGTHNVPYPYTLPSPQLKLHEIKKQGILTNLEKGFWANRHIAKDAVSSMLEPTSKIVGDPQISLNSTPTSSSFKIQANVTHHVPKPYTYPIPQLKLHDIKKQSILPDFKKGSWANIAKDAVGSMLGIGSRWNSPMASSNTAAYLNSGNGNLLASAKNKKNYFGSNVSYPSLTGTTLWNSQPGVGSDFFPVLTPSGFMSGSGFGPEGRESTGHQNDKPSVERNLDEILREFEVFKKFDTVEDCSDHHYGRGSSNQVNPPKNWAKRIQEEWKILEKDLPDRIFVRVYESRMDLLRAVIVGAEGTPYHDGLFFFDILFPTSYPNSPPQVYYHSGGLRLNPNLYNTGKVCLSLLNTWHGNSQNEQWIPGVSTMLQVLVSIQGLILNAQPFYNEPGYANMSGTKSADGRSLQYNENTFVYNLQTMVYTMRRPPKHFEALVAGHFCKHARDILVSCKAYMDGAQVGCLVRGGIQDLDEGDKCCSENFKYRLAGFITTLISAFSQSGAKNCEEFLSLAQKAKNGPPPVARHGSLTSYDAMLQNVQMQYQHQYQYQYPYM